MKKLAAIIGILALAAILGGTASPPPAPASQPVVKTTVVDAGVAVVDDSVAWVTERVALASPKPDYYHCILSKGCPGCITQNRYFNNPAVIADSRAFDCVKVYGDDRMAFARWLNHRGFGVTRFPSDVFTHNGKTLTYLGVPYHKDTAMPAAQLMRFYDARVKLGVTSKVRTVSFTPTLASPPLKSTPTKAQEAEHSVVTRTVSLPPRVAASSKGCCGRSYSRGMRGPGFIGRATFRPQRLFR